MSQHACGDEPVHSGVCLMEPHAAKRCRRNREFLELRQNQFCHHWNHFLEDLAAFLHEKLVPVVARFRSGAVQKAEIVANVVRELRLEPCPENLPMACRSQALVFDKNGRSDVPEDEMAVTVSPIEVPGTDFRIDDEDGSRMTGTNEVGRGLNAERGR